MEILIESMQATLLFLLNIFLQRQVFKNRRKLTVKGEAAFAAVGLLAAMAIGEFLSKTNLVVIFPLCYITFYCALTLILCSLLFQCSFRELLFCYFAIQGLMDDSFIVSKMLQSYFFRYMLEDLYSFMLSYAIVFGIALPAIFLFIRRGLRPLIDTTRGMAFWRYLWLVPVSYYLVYRMGISPKYLTVQSAWLATDVVVPLFWIVATCLSYLLIVDMLLGVVKNMEDRENLESINQQLVMQRERYDRLRDGIEETRRMRHDLRHQMLIIAGYVEKGDVFQIKEFVSSYLKEMEQEEEIPLCQNYAVDSIVNYYLRAAKKERIEMNVKLEIGRELPCGESDVCVILSNLLENAVEACRRQDGNGRFIDLKIGTGSQNMLTIVVTNSAPLAVRMRQDEFLSAKRNYSKTGWGISSVRRFADKYRGRAVFEQRDGKFYAKVYLQNLDFLQETGRAKKRAGAGILNQDAKV